MEHWEILAKEAKNKKELQKKYPLLGKKVRRKGKTDWEEGVIVLSQINYKQGQEYCIKFNEDGYIEQLDGLPYEIIN